MPTLEILLDGGPDMHIHTSGCVRMWWKTPINPDTWKGGGVSRWHPGARARSREHDDRLTAKILLLSPLGIIDDQRAATVKPYRVP